MKEQLIVIGYVALGALAVWLLSCYPDVLAAGLQEVNMSEETKNALLKNSNALFDHNSGIWLKESILTKLQKNKLSEIRQHLKTKNLLVFQHL